MTVITPPGIEPGGERVVRIIEGVGEIVFENYGPGQWLTQRGTPAKITRRRYLLDGEPVDSVSQIADTLRKKALERWIEDQATRGAVHAERMGELAGVPEEDWSRRVRALNLGASAKRDEGADRGTIVHDALHGLTRGIVPNPADVPALARPWLQGAMRAWIALGTGDTVISEEIVAHPELRYAGRPDLVRYVQGRLTLIDYKSSRGGIPYESAHYQARLYAMALECCGIAVQDVLLVGINNDAGFEIVPCDISEAEARSLVHVHRATARVERATIERRRIARAT